MKAKDLPFIPLGFAKMMKISPPPKVIKNFNERQVRNQLFTTNLSFHNILNIHYSNALVEHYRTLLKLQLLCP
jgi:hypothetical protein